MLTILAWMVFVPAMGWNIIMFCVIWSELMKLTSKVDWLNLRNIRDLVLSLAVLMIPGVYLFGWM
jgi:hypothetical protein